MIYIKKSQKADADVAFFNSDGSRSDACGNGTRCVAYLLSIEKNKKEIEISVSSKILKSKVLNNKDVETTGPIFDPFVYHFRGLGMEASMIKWCACLQNELKLLPKYELCTE